MNETVIQDTLYTWLKRSIGSPHVFKINFDIDFVTGNLIDASFDAQVIDQVSFDTDQATTLKALSLAITKTESIFKAVVTGPREITCTALENGSTITIVGPTVSGGATQPEATITDISDPVEVTVLFSDQNAPRADPPYPFATIRIDSVVQLGYDELRDFDSDTGIGGFGGQRKATVGIHFFGDNPMGEISKAFNALEKQTIIDLFSSSGISILEKNPVQNVTEMLETIFENHSFFDFYIGFADNYEDDLGIIENVELTSNYEETNIGEVVIGPKLIGP